LYFERCFLGTISHSKFGGYTLERVVNAIRQVGVESNVLATDLGQSANPLPAEGMRQFIKELIGQGFSEEQIERMARHNPAGLVDF
jgi:microsomal dipeptidase-like Zn-dependent dipeptidase